MAFTRRVDRFAAILCFLVAGAALLVAAFAVFDFTRGCATFRHGCFYIAFAAPLFLIIALITAGAGYWLWPRDRASPSSTRPPNER